MAIVNAPDGQVILVDSDGNTVGTFASIQDAVNAAGAADDVIYVGNGSYSVAALTANLTLDVENKTVSVGDLTGSGTIELAAGGSLTEGSDGASTTFKGAVTGANLNTDGLVKTGGGTLTLQNTTVTDTSVYVAGGEVDSKGTNAIDYLAVGEGGGNTGTFGISSGSLTVGNTVQGALQVGDFGGTGTFNQSGGTVTDDGAFNVGNQGGTGTYDLSGGKLVLTGGNIDVIGRNTASAGKSASNGTVAISGGLLDLQSGSELILGNNTNSAAGNGHGQIVQTGGTLEIEAGNHLYLSAAGNGEYDLNGGTLEVGGSNSLVQNYNGLGGTGSFNLGGGTIKVTGSELVTNVNATLTAGSTSTIDVGTLGADFTGAVTGSGNLDIAGSGIATFAHLATTGELNLEGGTLDVGSSTASVGDLTGSGTIELAAGGSLTEGSDGASTTFKGAVTGANLNTDGLVKTGGGTLTLQNTTVTDTSVYVAGGEVDSKGTNAIDYLAVGEGGGNTGTFGISSGSLTVGNTVQGALQVGDFGGTGTFNQSGGTVTDDGAFNVGNQGGTGTYNLSGGKLVLTGGNIDVIGRNTASAGKSASNGTVAISGGLLDLQSGSELILGNNTNSAAGNGHGQIVQTGGTLEIEAGNHLYLSAAGNGEYDLNGGTLEVGGSNSLVQNYNGLGGTGSFNLGGGTIKVTGSELVTNVNATLTAGSTSTIDVGALGADFTGAVTGSGNLDIAGSGVATFAHLATTGELNLEGGTLDVGSSTASVGDLTGSGTIELAAGGSLTEGSDGASTTFKGAVTGANLNTDGLVKTGGGTLTLQNTTVTDTSVYVAGGEVDSKGTNAIDYLAVGEGGGNTGTFGISSGSLTVGNTVQGALQVGDFGGTGTFNQSGGTVTDDGAFNVGNQGGTGTYDLSGGKLVLTGGNIDVIGRNTASAGKSASNGTVAISGGLLDLQSGSELILGNNTNSAAGNGHGQIVQTGGTLEIEAGNHLYLSAAGNGEYDLNGGTLEVGGSNSLVQNYNGLGGTGSFNLGGGTIKVTGSELVTNVNATLTAGSTSTIDVGTLGADFTGAVTGSGNLDIAGSGIATFAHLATTGELNLEGGTLDVGSSTASVGDLTGSGTIELAAGGSLTEGSDGASTTFKGAVTGANLNTDGLVKTGGGTLTLQNTTVTDTSVYVAGGEVDSKGTNSIDYLAVGEGGGNTGTFGISSGSLTVGNTVQGALQVGDFGGTGTFNQSGGTVTDDGAFNVGNQGGTGTYNLSGGTLVLTGGNIDVIGRNTASAGKSASNGTVAISGGLLDLQSGSELILGNNTNSAAGNGHGQIVQTGGTLEIEAGNHLYLSAAGNGEYDLNGGTLEVGGSNSLVQNYNGLGGTGSFNLGGGTIKVTGSELVTNVNATLTAGSTSTIDVGTLGADFTGAVTGSGNLDIAGSGIATFAHLATTGELNLEGGTLDVGSSTASVGDLTGSGTIELAAGGSLTEGSDGASTTFKGAVTGANLNTDGLVKTGSGTLTLQNTTVTDTSVYVAGGEVDSKGTNSIDYLAVGEGGGNTGTFGISSGSLTVGNTVQGALQVGDFGGTGTFNQSGGTVTDDGSFNVGNQGGTGTYNLSGGTLRLANGALDVIGRNDINHGGSSGTLAISGGLLDLQSGEIILGTNVASASGSNGHGLITQTGGTLEVEAGSQLFLSAAGNGEYDLDGGKLEVGGSNSLVRNYNGLGGTGSFNLGGGTIKVTGSELVTNVNATLTAGSTSTIDVGALGADFTGTITGSGRLKIEGTSGVATLSGHNDFSGGVVLKGGTLELGNAQAAGTGTIKFQNTPAGDPTLQIDGTVLPTNVIQGFGAGDKIDLADIASQPGSSADFDYVHNILHITEGSTTYQLNFNPSQNFAGEYFHLASDGSHGTSITVDQVACYCLGTLISTDRGDVAVEDLVIGDHVVTAAGASRPIKWIGQRSYGGRFLIGQRDLLPVCFKAGSLGDALPRRDLLVSPKHAMFIDGVLIPAEHLINGVSVVQLEQVDSVSYFHIELESHDVLLAEGAPSESFVDDESRGMFHNAHEFAKLYPDAEHVRATYYAPRVENGYELEAARRRIAMRAGLAVSPSASLGSLCGHVDNIDGITVRGWALNAARPEAPLCLDVLVDEVIVAQMLANQYRDDLAKAGIGSGHHGFAVELPAALLPKQLALLEVRRSLDGAVLRQSLCAVEAEAAAA